MVFRNLFSACDFKIAKAAVSAGTSDTVTFNQIDMQGYDSVLVIAQLGAITSTGTADLRAKGSNTSNSYGSGTVSVFVDASGNIVKASAANTTADDSSTLLVLDLYQPGVRYVRPELVRGTANVVLAGAVYILYNARSQPVTPTGVATGGTGAGTAGAAFVSNPSLSAS